MIELIDIYKTYPPKHCPVVAVNGVSTKFENGYFYAITGRSGSGKSTLLHLIGGLDNPDKGSILYNGKCIVSYTDRQLTKFHRNTVGFIFQDFYLEPNYSCQENIEIALIGNKMRRPERINRCKELLNLVDLINRSDHKPTQLSGGEKQRVALARALANDPEVILADEPTGNLDSASGKRVINLLKELTLKGKTVIMITHNNDDARIADKHLTMFDGRIVSQEGLDNDS